MMYVRAEHGVVLRLIGFFWLLFLLLVDRWWMYFVFAIVIALTRRHAMRTHATAGVGCFIGRRVPGKGIIPNPLKAKEADRLKVI